MNILMLIEAGLSPFVPSGGHQQGGLLGHQLERLQVHDAEAQEHQGAQRGARVRPVLAAEPRHLSGHARDPKGEGHDGQEHHQEAEQHLKTTSMQGGPSS